MILVGLRLRLIIRRAGLRLTALRLRLIGLDLYILNELVLRRLFGAALTVRLGDLRRLLNATNLRVAATCLAVRLFLVAIFFTFALVLDFARPPALRFEGVGLINSSSAIIIYRLYLCE